MFQNRTIVLSNFLLKQVIGQNRRALLVSDWRKDFWIDFKISKELGLLLG